MLACNQRSKHIPYAVAEPATNSANGQSSRNNAGRRRCYGTWNVPATLVAFSLLLAGCTGGSEQYLSIGTAPPGGTFHPVGAALAETLNEHVGNNGWKAQAIGTKGSQENIRRLNDGRLQLALSNASITYFAARGEATWDKPYDVRAVMTLAPNAAMFITRADSGIRTMADLKGKRIVIGPSGAGFEMFVEPILQEHGLSLGAIRKLNATQSEAVDYLSDGSADAAFLGGAIPTAAITQACSTFDVYFIPYDEDARERLAEKYPFFQSFTVPQATYAGLTGDFLGLNVGSMHLITSAKVPEETIYGVTKAIWENREDVAKRHRETGNAINAKVAPKYEGVEFHPGAIKFYKEIGVWPENEADEEQTDEKSEKSSS